MKTVKCKKCGNKYDPQFVVCPACGSEVKKAGFFTKADANRFIKAGAVISIVILLASVTSNVLGYFRMFESSEKEIEKVTTVAELSQLGVEYLIVDAKPSQIEQGNILICEFNPDTGIYEVTLSAGCYTPIAEDWVFHDINEVLEIESRYWNVYSCSPADDSDQPQYTLNATKLVTVTEEKVFCEYLKEGLILRQSYETDSGDVALLPGTELGEDISQIKFTVVSHNPSDRQINEELIFEELTRYEQYDFFELIAAKKPTAEQLKEKHVISIMLFYYEMNKNTEEIGEMWYPYIFESILDTEAPDGKVTAANFLDDSQIIALTISNTEDTFKYLPILIGKDITAALSEIQSIGIAREYIIAIPDSRIPAVPGRVTTVITSNAMRIDLKAKELIYILYFPQSDENLSELDTLD